MPQISRRGRRPRSVTPGSSRSRNRQRQGSYRTPSNSGQGRRNGSHAGSNARDNSSGRRGTRSTSGTRSRGNRRVTPGSSSTGRSIRDTARNPTRGLGIRTGDYYVPSQQDSPRREDTEQSEREGGDDNESVSLSQQSGSADVPDVPDVPRVKRHCYCDVACDKCTDMEACIDHDGLYCSGTCERYFHFNCIKWIREPSTNDSPFGSISPPWREDGRSITLNAQTQESSCWYCTKCWEENKRNAGRLASATFIADLPDIQSEEDIMDTDDESDRKVKALPYTRLKIRERAERMGLLLPPFHEDFTEAMATTIVSQEYNRLQEIIDPDLFQQIVNSHPRCFPTESPINPDLRRKMAVSGRRFEVLLLCFTIETCASCGIVTPVHQDPLSGEDDCAQDMFTRKPTRLKRQHLRRTFKDAFRCHCNGPICRGENYFPPSHGSALVRAFQEHHEMQTPKARYEAHCPFITKVRLCYHCYRTRDLDPLLPPKFSARNGYGPMQPVSESVYRIYDTLSENHQMLINRVRELDYLLRNLTYGEECAIRTIVPAISITRLKYGNIASKGNVTCMNLDNKMFEVIPRLPTECRTVVIQRKGSNTRAGLASFKFQRNVIENVCRLITAVKPPGYENIGFSQRNLSQWPAEGNLLDHADVINESDDCDSGLPNPGSARESDNSGTSESSGGPAPLQNLEEDEVFSGAYSGSAKPGSVSIQVLNASADLAELSNQLADAAEENPELGGNSNAPRQIPIRLTGNIAYARQSLLQPFSGFANMDKDPFAWTRAFPSLFRPCVVMDETGVPQVQINGDLKGWRGNRFVGIHLYEWAKWLMWRSDGLAVKHPTFALVLNNHKFRKSLLSQGRSALHLDNTVDETTTIRDWQAMLARPVPGAAANNAAAPNANPNNTRAPRSHLHSLLNYHAGNVVGTDQYYGGIRRQWEAISNFHSHINNREATHFHTCSMAEFHDPFLRRLLSKYVAQVTYPEHEREAAANEVLNNLTAFRRAVSSYKHIVTHFFSCKWEIWCYCFLRPVVGLIDNCAMKEFTDLRGAIHVHSILYTDCEADRRVSESLHQLSLSLYEAVHRLDDYIMENAEALSQANEIPPTSIFDCEAGLDEHFKSMKKVCGNSREGEMAWEECQQAMADAQKQAAEDITKVMMEEDVVSALHPGLAQREWIEPPGPSDLGYRGGSSFGMQTKRDVLEVAELQKFKFNREDQLYCRKVNTVNHVFTHSCNPYCIREHTIDVDYDEGKHYDEKKGELKSFVVRKYEKKDANGNMTHKVKIKVQFCRFGFGYLRMYGRGSVHDRTGGKPPCFAGYLEYDENNMPQFVAPRNHHRVLQEPLFAFHFGSNSDSRRFISQSVSYANIPNSDICPERYYKALHALGREGICRACGSEKCVFYATGYCCKGNKSSDQWAKVLDSISTAYVENDRFLNGVDANNVPLFAAIAKWVRTMGDKKDVSKDQAVFHLSGGFINTSTTKVKGCSVSSIYTSDIAALATDASSSSAFNFPSLLKKYKVRKEEHDNYNLYKYASSVYGGASPKNPIAPNFMGYDPFVSWPLSEDYSRIMLTIYKPWRTNPDTLRDEGDQTFATALIKFMWNHEHFPTRIAIKIFQSRIRWKPPRLDAPATNAAAAGGGSPSLSVTNSETEEAAA